jgi:hypothetical protein
MVSDKKGNILISIVIPTFNGMDRMKRIIDPLMSIIREFDNVNIFISDNASEDGSSNFLLNYCDYFNIHIQAENIGAAANFVDIIKRANGEFVLLIGDDDFPCLQELSKLVELLSSTKENFLAIFSNIITDGTRLLDSEKVLSLTEAIKFSYHIGNIGTSLINREAFLLSIDDIFEKYNLKYSHWPQIIYTYYALYKFKGLVKVVDYRFVQDTFTGDRKSLGFYVETFISLIDVHLVLRNLSGNKEFLSFLNFGDKFFRSRIMFVFTEYSYFRDIVYFLNVLKRLVYRGRIRVSLLIFFIFIFPITHLAIKVYLSYKYD